MSIDARVVGISLNHLDKSGKLILEDRPAKKGNDGIKGQTFLHFDKAPEWLDKLVDKDVWGSSDTLMYGEQKIAKRIGYTSIEFVADKLHGKGPQQLLTQGE